MTVARRGIRMIAVTFVAALMSIFMVVSAPLKASAFLPDVDDLVKVGRAVARTSTPVRAVTSVSVPGLVINGVLVAGTLAWTAYDYFWNSDEEVVPPAPETHPNLPPGGVPVSPQFAAGAKQFASEEVMGLNIVLDAQYCSFTGEGVWGSDGISLTFTGHLTGLDGWSPESCAGRVVPPTMSWTADYADRRTGEIVASKSDYILRTNIVVDSFTVSPSMNHLRMVQSETGIPEEYLTVVGVHLDYTDSNESPTFTPTITQSFTRPLGGGGEPGGSLGVFSMERKCNDGSTVSSVGGPDWLLIPDPCESGSVATGLDIIYGNELIHSSFYDPVWTAQAAQDYALCVTASGVPTGDCTLSVLVDGLKCATGVPGCADWYDIGIEAPDKVQCWWGPYRQSLGDCLPLRNAYLLGHGMAVDYYDAEALPFTPVDPERDPTKSPAPAVDPEGTPLPDTEPIGRGDPDVLLSGRSPTVGRDADLDPQNFTQCISAGWSWNPVDWVFTPTKCALQWAFVPSPQVQTQLATRIDTAVSTTSIGAWSTAFSGYSSAFNAGQGNCMGPAVNLGHPFNETIYPAAACSGPSKVLADVSRIGLSALLVVSGGWACIRLITAGVGYSGASSA